MAEVSKRITSAEGELAGMLDERTGGDDDLAGIAAWRNELA